MNTSPGTPVVEMSWKEAAEISEATNGDPQEAKKNDKAKHRLIDIAKESNSGKKWRTILAKFRANTSDLRPGVIKRAIQECPEGLRPDFESLGLLVEIKSLIGHEEPCTKRRGLWRMIEAAKNGVFTWSEVISAIVADPTIVRENLCQGLQELISAEEWDSFLLQFGQSTVNYLKGKKGRNEEYETSDIALMHLLIQFRGEREVDMLFRELGRLPGTVYNRIRRVLKPTEIERLEDEGWKVTDKNDRRTVLVKYNGSCEQTKVVNHKSNQDNHRHPMAVAN